MPSTLYPSTGNAIPGWRPGPLQWPVPVAEFNPAPEWPQDVIQSIRSTQAKRVLPSFGSSGIPTPTVMAPLGTGGAMAAPTTGTTPNYLAPLGTGAGTGANPFFTISNVKSPAIDARIGNLLTDFDKLRTAGTGDFDARYAETKPQFRGILDEDLGAAGDFFSGAMESKLKALRESRKTAVRGAVDRALGDLSRILNLGASNIAGGVSNPSGSGFLTALGLDRASQIETQAALDDTTQARGDVEYLNAAKLGLLGKRSDLLQGDLNRSLMPSQISADFYNKLIHGLMPLIAGNNQNTTYGIQAPGGYVGESFGGLQASRLADLGRIQQGQQFDATQALKNLQFEQDALNSNRAYSNTLFDNQLNREQADNQNTLREQENATNRLRVLLGLGG